MPANAIPPKHKNAKPGSNKTRVTPQSSLGELGRSLLKFIVPIRRVKAHTKVHDYLDKTIHSKEEAAHTLQESVDLSKTDLKANIPGTGSTTLGKAGSSSTEKGQEGSGYINVKREPRTVWLEMVTGLMRDCDEKAANTRSALGNHTYRDVSKNSSELRRKTVGRIINLVTEEDSADELSAKVPKKPSDNTQAPGQQERRLSNQYEIDGKPKKKNAA